MHTPEDQNWALHFPGFQCPDGWRVREQAEKEETNLLLG
jgi:hypothetical protein